MFALTDIDIPSIILTYMNTRLLYLWVSLNTNKASTKVREYFMRQKYLRQYNYVQTVENKLNSHGKVPNQCSPGLPQAQVERNLASHDLQTAYFISYLLHMNKCIIVNMHKYAYTHANIHKPLDRVLNVYHSAEAKYPLGIFILFDLKYVENVPPNVLKLHK